MVVIQVGDVGVYSLNNWLLHLVIVPCRKLTCRAALQGGIGPLGLACEDLYVLDFTEPERPRWHRCGPSLRLPILMNATFTLVFQLR